MIDHTSYVDALLLIAALASLAKHKAPKLEHAAARRTAEKSWRLAEKVWADEPEPVSYFAQWNAITYDNRTYSAWLKSRK